MRKTMKVQWLFGMFGIVWCEGWLKHIQLVHNSQNGEHNEIACHKILCESFGRAREKKGAYARYVAYISNQRAGDIFPILGCRHSNAFEKFKQIYLVFHFCLHCIFCGYKVSSSCRFQGYQLSYFSVFME